MKTIEILEQMNAWRRYDGDIGTGPDQPCPKEFGLAIDDAVRKLKAADVLAKSVDEVICAMQDKIAEKRLYMALLKYDHCADKVYPC